MIRLITISMLLLSYCSFAQNNSDNRKENFKQEDRYWSVGFGIYAHQYFGDLHPFSADQLIKFRDYYPGLAISLRRKISSHFSYQMGFSWARLAGSDFKLPPEEDDAPTYTRNLSFRNDLLNLDFFMRYDLLPTRNNYLDRPAITPYLFLGLGIGYSNPKARIPEFGPNNERFPDFGNWHSLRPLGTEGQFSDRYDTDPYSWIQLSIPAGIGMSFKINNYWNINFDVSYRYLTTDYIDDVSGSYVDKGIFNDPYALALTDRSKEPNSANGRYPRDFNYINNFTETITYQSEVDSDKVFEVFNGYGREGFLRGDGKDMDFYVSMGLSLIYIFSEKKNK